MKILRLTALSLISIGLYLITTICGQSRVDFQEIDGMFFSAPYGTLQEGIREASQKQAMYAYNISNLTVPGFTPILPKKDQILLNELAQKEGYNKEVMLEFIMSRMTENSKRYNAYLAMWKNKVDGLKRIVTMGK